MDGTFKMETFGIGRIAQVKNSLIDEDSGIDMKGAKGIIRMIYDPEEDGEEPTIQLEWTAETLAMLPDDYFLKSFGQEVSWTNYYLPQSELELTEESADELAMAWQKQAIFTRLFLSDLGREGRLIAKIFENPVDPARKSPDGCWFDFFSANVTWPLKGRICYPYEEDDGILKENDRIQVMGLNGMDVGLGIWADATFKEKALIIPLGDIASADYSKNGRYLDAYGLWLACCS